MRSTNRNLTQAVKQLRRLGIVLKTRKNFIHLWEVMFKPELMPLEISKKQASNVYLFEIKVKCKLFPLDLIAGHSNRTSSSDEMEIPEL